MNQNTKVKTSTGKTFARQEFLSDVVTTALEGGVGYWCRVQTYRWFSPTLDGGTAEHETVDGVEFPNAYAVDARDIEEYGSYDKAPSLGDITVHTIARGILRLLDPNNDQARVNTDMTNRIAQANRENDAGYLDAYDADAIVQAGLFGEVVYG